MALRLIKEDPIAFEKHLRYFTAGTVMEVFEFPRLTFYFSEGHIQSTYGIKTQEQDDPYVKVVEEAVSVVGVLIPGAFLVDIFPIREYFSASTLLLAYL